MKAVDLYKYIQNNNIEWHREEKNGEEDVIIFPYFFQIKEFYELLDPTIFDDDGIECVMKDGYLAIWMKDICEYYDIDVDLNDIFEGDSYDR